MKENFHRVYNDNRAPFGIYLHAAWFLVNDNHLPAYKEFLDYLDDLPDVYFVSSSRVIDYVRNPRPVGEEPTVAPPTTTEPTTTTTEAPETPETRAANWQIFDSCQTIRTPTCEPRLCQLIRQDVNEERWMKSCPICPDVYPWVGNPLGVYIPPAL